MQTLRLFAILLPVLMILPGRDPLAADRALVPAPAPAALSMPQGAPEPKRVTSDPPAPMAGEVAVEGIIDAVVKDQGRLQVSIFRVAAPGGAEERSKAPLPGTLLLGMTRSLVPPLGPDGERVPADALRPGTPFTAAIAWPVPPSPSVLAVRRLTVGVPEAPAGAAPASGENSLGAVAPDRISDAPVVVPMVFPVIGPVSWQDTFLASRGGGTRRHRGQDILAPKMTPVVAAFDGTVRPRVRNGHYLLTLVGDHGWSAEYMHLNNDTPGTDDGQGGEMYAFAPGIYPGARVVAGQLLGWVGDSGNAEGTVPHLHFELVHQATGVAVNAASLRLARRIAAPRLPELLPDLKPGPGEGPLERLCARCRHRTGKHRPARERARGAERAVDRADSPATVHRLLWGGHDACGLRGRRGTPLPGGDHPWRAAGRGWPESGRRDRSPRHLCRGGRSGARQTPPCGPRGACACRAGGCYCPCCPLALGGAQDAGCGRARACAARGGSSWVHGYVLAGLAEGRVKIRMDAVRLPGSREVIRSVAPGEGGHRWRPNPLA